jgi:large subunit ribosomal protein L5
MSYVPRLKKHYDDVVVSNMLDQFKYKSRMEVPKITKVVLNQGVKGATADKKLVDIAVNEMTSISGQKAVSTKARISVSNFKLREGMPIGAKVTLRRERMYEFLDRLLAVSLPRVRDFRGLNPKGFDGRGNFNMGVTEQIIFPEIDIDKISKITGMDITIVTTAQTDEEGKVLLMELGFPFKK